MSNSPLVTRWWAADPSNYTVGRPNGKIRGIVIHHAASTSLNSVGTVFARAGRGGSAHYGVCGNQIHQYIDEKNTAWHCSNWWGNTVTVGIELVNSTGAPEWKVSDETLETACRLVADIAKRNNLGKLYYDPKADCSTITGHRDWQGAQTACPGPYVYSRLQYICDRANQINAGVVWTDCEKTAATIKGTTNLTDVSSGRVIKALSGTFEFVQKTKDGVWARTAYSKSKNLNYGVKVSDLVITKPAEIRTETASGASEKPKTNTQPSEPKTAENKPKNEPEPSSTSSTGTSGTSQPEPAKDMTKNSKDTNGKETGESGSSDGRSAEPVDEPKKQEENIMDEKKLEEIAETAGTVFNPTPKQKLIAYLVGDALVVGAMEVPLIINCINAPDLQTFGTALATCLSELGAAVLLIFKLTKKK